MKNKKIIRKFTVLLAALVIMCGFSVTAYAGGGDESDDTPTPVTEETPAPETEPEETTGGYEPQPLTPEELWIMGASDEDADKTGVFFSGSHYSLADDSREWLETRIRKLSENAEIEEKINEGEQAE